MKPRRAYRLVERLYRMPNSTFRAVLLDEYSKEPPSNERKQKLDRLRHVGYSMESYKLASIDDRLASLERILLSSHGVKSDKLPEFSPSYRPDLPITAGSNDDGSDEVEEARKLRKNLRAIGAL